MNRELENIQPEDLFPTEVSKKVTLESILSTLNIPLKMAEYIPNNGLTSIEDSRGIRRALALIQIVIESLTVLLMQDENQSTPLKNILISKLLEGKKNR